jgi:hypothetical protein
MKKPVELYSLVQWLPDCSEKHGEDLCLGLCRTCNVKPEQQLNNIIEDESPK